MSFFNTQSGAVKLYGPVSLPLSSSPFGTHVSHFGIGGFSELPNIQTRNAIPIAEEMNGDGVSSGRRKLGMVVYTIDEGKFFQLVPLSSDGINKAEIPYSVWENASDAQKMVWLDPLQQREDIYGSSPTFNILSGTNDPNDCWKEIFFNPALPTVGNFLPLSGGTVTGDLVVDGSFMVNGSATFVNSTNLSIEDPLIFIAQNNPANLVDMGIVGQFVNSPTQFTGLVRDYQTNQWFLFSGLTGVELTATDLDFTDNALKIDTLRANLIGDLLSSTRVFGTLSASGDVYGSNLRWREWDSTYTTVSANSASWGQNITDLRSLSANWQSTFSTTSALSSNWNSVFTTVSANSATWGQNVTDLRALSANWQSTFSTTSALSSNWNSVFTTVSANSASWGQNITDLRSLSANWQSTFSTTSALSSNWNSVFTTVSSNSAVWGQNVTDLRSLSANWQSTFSTTSALSSNWNSVFTTVSANSATWGQNVTDLRALSANWQSTFSTTSALSSNWNSVFTTVSANSATWNAADEILVAQIFNADSVTLNRGDVVYSFGATGSVMSVKLASNASESTSSKTLGFVNETIIPNGIGYATVAGRIDKLSLPAPFVDGDALWLGSTPGTFTRIKPTAPQHSVYLGVVERANNGNGIAYVKVQNGYELDEIHDVLITSVSAGQVLRRNSSNNLWTNVNDAFLWDSVFTTVSANSASRWDNSLANSYADGKFLPLSGGTIDGDLTINGSFYISGSAAQISATNISIADPLIFLAHGNPTNVFDLGFVAEYSQSPLGQQHTGLVRLHDIGEWTLFTGLTTEPLTSTTISRTDSTFKIDTLNANLKGNLLTSTNVFGYLSSNNVLYANQGNSDNWNSAFTTVSANSATWGQSTTNLRALSANWQSTFLTTSALSSNWNSVFTTVSANSAAWNTAYTTVSSSILHKGNSFGETILIGSNDPYSLVLETSGTPRITILSGGNVGIGNSSPNYPLTVTGDISANAVRLTSSTAGTLGIQFGTDTNLYRSDANTLKTDDSFVPSLTTSTTSNTVVVAQTTTDNTLQKRAINSQVWNTTATFITGDSSFVLTQDYIPKASGPSSLKNSQIFDNGAKIGIGTTTPSEKLTVVGSISASDYVYQRTKLKFVTTNYMFSAEDQNSLVLFNSTTPVSAFVPSDAAVGFSIGSSINFAALDAIVFVAGDSGVTIRAADNRYYLRTSNSTATVMKIGSNEWLLFGDIWGDNI